jgi:short-subunit dehydrogenase
VTQAPSGLIILTGASSGIGRAAALALGNQGHALLLVGRRRGALEETAAFLPPQRTFLFRGDITNRDDRSALETTLSRIPLPLVGLINAAGIVHRSPIEQTPPAQIEALFNTNALAPAHLISMLWPRLLAARSAHLTPRIINIASLAVQTPLDGLFAYAASKFALAGLTVAAAEQGRRDGIVCLCLCPGSTNTPMLHSVVNTSAMPTDHIMSPDTIADLISRGMQGHLDHHHGKCLPVLPRAQETWWQTQRTQALANSAWLGLDEAIFL